MAYHTPMKSSPTKSSNSTSLLTRISSHQNSLYKSSTLLLLSAPMMEVLYRTHNLTSSYKKLITTHHLSVPRQWPTLLLSSQSSSSSYFTDCLSYGLTLLSNPSKSSNLHSSIQPSTHQSHPFFITTLLSLNDHYFNSCPISSHHSSHQLNLIILHHRRLLIFLLILTSWDMWGRYSSLLLCLRYCGWCCCSLVINDW